MKKEDFFKFLREHKVQLLLTFCGLITAILMLTIGFFRTLLICLLTGLLGGYGCLVDKAGFKGANEIIKKFFKR